jgi:hypothetical protein
MPKTVAQDETWPGGRQARPASGDLLAAEKRRAVGLGQPAAGYR